MVNGGDHARALWNESSCWSNVDTTFQRVLDSKRVWCLSCDRVYSDVVGQIGPTHYTVSDHDIYVYVVYVYACY